MASMLDKMNPEVAKKAIEQFPNFSETVKEIVAEYKDYMNKALASNAESVASCYETYDNIIKALQQLLDKDDLTFDEKIYNRKDV